MPAVPELGHAFTEIGKIEIFHRFKAQYPGNTDGDIRISGEIAVNPETVKVGGNWLEYFWREYWKTITAVLGAISLILGIILSLKKLLKRKEKNKDAG